MSIQISSVQSSNLFTMGCCAVKDPRQAVPAKPTIPDEPTRRLRARLILEEAIETVNALGFRMYAKPIGNMSIDKMIDVRLVDELAPNLEEIIDGCCDLDYVTIGTLAACGVPDLPHLFEVCRANDRKFPTGEAITDEHGKFQKPAGWKGPDHAAVMKDYAELDFQEASRTSMKVIGAYVKTIHEMNLQYHDRGSRRFGASE